MGNSASTSFIMSTPRKLSWGRQREDTVKLEDLLTQYEEDIWRVKAKQSLSVKKVHLTRSIRYTDLAAQQSDSCLSHSAGGMLNLAFVGDQSPWETEFTVNSQNDLNNPSKNTRSVALLEDAIAHMQSLQQ